MADDFVVQHVKCMQRQLLLLSLLLLLLLPGDSLGCIMLAATPSS